MNDSIEQLVKITQNLWIKSRVKTPIHQTVRDSLLNRMQKQQQQSIVVEIQIHT